MNGEPVLVMLVEDNADHAELVMRALAEHQVSNRIQHFVDGQAALDYLFHRGAYANVAEHPYPHVVLLDLRLPRIDGLEVLKRIKESDEIRHIPVVVLTTSDADRDVVRAYDHHVNSYLVKPIGYEAFRELMEDLGFYWLGWNTRP
jgi:CheY-like chemotaxis protein